MGCFGSKEGVGGGAPAAPARQQDHEPETAQEEAAQLSIRSPTPRSAGGAGPRTTHIRERLIHETHEDPLALFDSVKQLGSGVSGSVHLVRSKRTGLEYALKLLAKDMFSSDTFDQFLQEVTLLRELDHPHIVRLVEVFNLQDGVNLALLMEFLSGGELYNALQEQKDQRFSEESAKDIMRQLVSAVAFLHSQGIVHRDLKLENFLFTKRPSDGGTVVKLIDLGLSRRYGTGERTAKGALVIRRMHSVVGTPYYIAPEILAEADTSGGAKRGYDHLVDSWSLGVIAYMLISGTPPFAGTRDNDVLNSVMKGKFTLQGPRWAGISEACKDFVRQLLVFRPEHRMTAAAAASHSWLASLTAKLEGQPLAEALPTEFLPNLRYFHTLGGWKKAALEAVAFSCPDAQVEHLRGAFERMDSEWRARARVGPGAH
jgi:calcium-dependent protein kinase